MIHIYVRMCHTSMVSTNKSRPYWFDKKDIYRNLLNQLTPVRDVSEDCDWEEPEVSKITVIFDEFYGPIDPTIPKILPKYGDYYPDIQVINIKAGSETKSFNMTLDIILANNHKPEDIIYIVEDDYLHTYGYDKVIEMALDNPLVHYVSLYDHPDKYDTKLYPNLACNLIRIDSKYWRTTPSTTNTFACKYKTLLEDIGIHRKHSPETQLASSDHQKFLELWQHKRVLVTPIPTLSTHVEEGVIAGEIYEWKRLSHNCSCPDCPRES